MRIDKFSIRRQLLNTDKCLHLVIFLDIQQILDGTALGCPCPFRNLVNRQPETTTFESKEQ